MLAHAAAAALLAIAVLPPVLAEATAAAVLAPAALPPVLTPHRGRCRHTATVLAPAALSSVVAKASFAAAVLAPAALPKRTGLPEHARFLVRSGWVGGGGVLMLMSFKKWGLFLAAPTFPSWAVGLFLADLLNFGEKKNSFCTRIAPVFWKVVLSFIFSSTTRVSDIKGLPYLLHHGELLRLREPQKWILRPIWGLGGYT